MDNNNQTTQNIPLDSLNPLVNTVVTQNSNIVWNESEETFLQNLFANTLLNDNFVEKPDFDLGLGFDNLQLNYESSQTDASNQLTILSLDDPVIHLQDQPNFISGTDVLITSESLTDKSFTDDKLFKKPSSDLMTINNLPKKAKKKSDLNADTSENFETNPLPNKLKRSMKRSKLLNAKSSNQDLILSKSVPVCKHIKYRQPITNSNTSNNKNFLKLGSSNVKNANNLRQHKKIVHKNSSTSLSTNDSVSLKSLDLEKNIFVLKETLSDSVSTNSLVIKRDEFDLQIKELSLLDLHSSEDDSSSQDPNKLKSAPLALSRAESKTELLLDNKLLETAEQSNITNTNLSEIITKRIKYSKNTSLNESNVDSEHQSKNESREENTRSPKHKLDKFIQYFKSLDSSNKEPVILNQKNSKKSLDSLLSPPSPSNSQKTQYKRKKKDVQSASINDSSQRPIILISLQSEQQKIKTPQINRQPQQLTINLENDTLLHMKNLDINTEQSNQNSNNRTFSETNNVSLNISDKNSRNYLWNLLKTNSTQEELIENFGSILHDKISFWDLVQLKLKYSKSNHLKTTYEIIDDYTLLYSNMSALLERFVNEQSNLNSLMSKSDNSSRSRSSSRNVRKHSTSGSNR